MGRLRISFSSPIVVSGDRLEFRKWVSVSSVDPRLATKFRNLPKPPRKLTLSSSCQLHSSFDLQWQIDYYYYFLRQYRIVQELRRKAETELARLGPQDLATLATHNQPQQSKQKYSSTKKEKNFRGTKRACCFKHVLSFTCQLTEVQKKYILECFPNGLQRGSALYCRGECSIGSQFAKLIVAYHIQFWLQVFIKFICPNVWCILVLIYIEKFKIIRGRFAV